MARDEAAPFARGETYYNGGTIDPNDLGGPNLVGKEFLFEVNAPDATLTTNADPSGRSVRCRIVRNLSGVNLKPARIAHFKPAYPYKCNVDGYTFAVGDRPAGVIDEFLPAAGVPPNDLFYLVVEGPTTVTQTHTSAATIAVGSALVPVAGGASTLTDDLGGRVGLQDLTGATSALANNIQNLVAFGDAANAAVVDALVLAVATRRSH